MKLLLNDKEIANFLFVLAGIDKRPIKRLSFGIGHIDSAIEYVCREKNKNNFNLDKKRDKLKAKIRRAVEKDLGAWVKSVSNEIKNQREKKFKCIHKKLDHFFNRLGEENILNAYMKFDQKNFIKGTGLHIDSSAQLMRRIHFSDVKENCLLRNTVGNEKLLVEKIDNNYPFWFIDSGYTNFVESNKKWHRLVPNHLHYGKFFDAPVDRLGNFSKFPEQWREGGDKILVIEPGNFAAEIFHIDIKQWKYDVEAELRKYTDKRIIFREKTPKKTRAPLYKHLLDNDYYCVVSINSNAATEAIWAGVPAITLDTHITNPVTRNKLSDINDLYRPHLSQWLCMLSYSQFTYEELLDGTAVEIVKKYHV